MVEDESRKKEDESMVQDKSMEKKKREKKRVDGTARKKTSQ